MLGILLSLSVARALTPVHLERVDIISEDPGTWIHDDLPVLLNTPRAPALHFAEQIKLVWAIPIEGLSIGTSYQSQSLFYERSLLGWQNINAGVGLQTFLLLPRGLWVDVSWRRGPLRLALGFSALSDASWTHLSWNHWRYLPTVGIGLGRSLVKL